MILSRPPLASLPRWMMPGSGRCFPGRRSSGSGATGCAQCALCDRQFDIATTLAASIARPRPGAIYAMADDRPAPPQEVIACAAALLGVDPPPEEPFEAAGLTGMAASFYAEAKRVRNARIKAELGVRLACPGYPEGLRAILAAERG
jgi:hypothetical protein